VAVEVILGDVQQEGGVGRELARVLQLKARGLADHHRARRERAHERGDRGAHVSRHGHVQLGGPVDGAEQLRGGGLAVRARDRQKGVREESPGKLELAVHG
jgi:hypothetical protein